MIDLRVYLDADDTRVALEFPDVVLTLTAPEVDELIRVLSDIRSHMSPPSGEQPAPIN